jgi:hypothetical protein
LNLIKKKEASSAKNQQKHVNLLLNADISPGGGGVAVGVTLNGVGGGAAGRRSEGAGEERIHLVPEIAPHPYNPPALPSAEILRHRRDYAPKAAPAVGGRHVRRALRDPVDGGVACVETLFPVPKRDEFAAA